MPGTQAPKVKTSAPASMPLLQGVARREFDLVARSLFAVAEVVVVVGH